MNFKNTLIAAAVMLAAWISLPYLSSSNDQPLKRSLSEFPMQIGEWRGMTGRFNDKVYAALGVDDSILATYHKSNSENIQLYIGYYTSQRKGELIHSPKNCMPGSGWNIVDTAKIKINLKNPNSGPITAIKLVLQKGIQRQVAIYWFHSRGRVISSEYFQKIYLVWDAITKHRTDGSFIRLLSLTTDTEQEKTTEIMTKFVEQIFPILSDFIPA